MSQQEELKKEYNLSDEEVSEITDYVFSNKGNAEKYHVTISKSFSDKAEFGRYWSETVLREQAPEEESKLIALADEVLSGSEQECFYEARDGRIFILVLADENGNIAPIGQA